MRVSFPIKAKDSFQTRAKDAVNGKFLPCMRRSMQSLVLYEANRCLTTRYGQLRPFQRKYACNATAVDLLGTLDFLDDFHRQEIMFRTKVRKDVLQPDLAWRRMKLISQEINQVILPKVKELMENEENGEKSHDEICEMLLQSMYEDSTENTKPHPPMWEFNHNNALTVYRVYYRGIGPDPDIFAPNPPRFVDVPSKKPAGGWSNCQAPNSASSVDGDTLVHLPNMTINSGKVHKNNDGRSDEERRAMLKEVKDHTEAPNSASSVDGDTLVPLANMTINAGSGHKNNDGPSDEERRAMLKEVKDHTELLKEFEGIIPEEELAKRKRALYAALPPVPPPATAGGGRGARKQNKSKGKLEALMATEEAEWEKLPADNNREEAVKDLDDVQFLA